MARLIAKSVTAKGWAGPWGGPDIVIDDKLNEMTIGRSIAPGAQGARMPPLWVSVSSFALLRFLLTSHVPSPGPTAIIFCMTCIHSFIIILAR